MTGKQLKDWACNVPDHAQIEMRDSYARWNSKFALRATTESVLELKEETEEAKA